MTLFSVTESRRGDKITLSLEMELRKFSINIFMGLELIFCLVSSTIWEIEVRTYSVSKKINKSLYFRGTFGASNFKFTFETGDKRKKIRQQNLRNPRTHLLYVNFNVNKQLLIVFFIIYLIIMTKKYIDEIFL